MLGMDTHVVFILRSHKGKINFLEINSVSCRKLKKNTITIERDGKISNMICWRTRDVAKA
jgi:hypothetical protein